jgi:hypothetical protein
MSGAPIVSSRHRSGTDFAVAGSPGADGAAILAGPGMIPNIDLNEQHYMVVSSFFLTIMTTHF